jgi:hypothetical protein
VDNLSNFSNGTQKNTMCEGWLSLNKTVGLYTVALFSTSSTSILPFSIVLVTIIFIPAIAAEAGFVP